MVAHLCSRLLESSAEIRSTILVQRSYRAYLERTGRGDFVERARAAKAKARAKAAADRAKALLRQGLLPPTSPALRRGSSSGKIIVVGRWGRGGCRYCHRLVAAKVFFVVVIALCVQKKVLGYY